MPAVAVTIIDFSEQPAPDTVYVIAPIPLPPLIETVADWPTSNIFDEIERTRGS